MNEDENEDTLLRVPAMTPTPPLPAPPQHPAQVPDQLVLDISAWLTQLRTPATMSTMPPTSSGMHLYQPTSSHLAARVNGSVSLGSAAINGSSSARFVDLHLSGDARPVEENEGTSRLGVSSKFPFVQALETADGFKDGASPLAMDLLTATTPEEFSPQPASLQTLKLVASDDHSVGQANGTHFIETIASDHGAADDQPIAATIATTNTAAMSIESIAKNEDEEFEVLAQMARNMHISASQAATISGLEIPSSTTPVVKLSEHTKSKRRAIAKLGQPWRRRQLPDEPTGTTKTTPATLTKVNGYGCVEPSLTPPSLSQSQQQQHHHQQQCQQTSKPIVIPHDILLIIFSYIPDRANAQQYFDRSIPSDLIQCSRVNMAWRMAALSKIWQTIALPDPIDPSCKNLLQLMATSLATSRHKGQSFDLTEMVQRVEINLMDMTELKEEPAMWTAITTLLRCVSPFQSLAIDLPQEIDRAEAEVLTRVGSVAALGAIVDGIQDAKVQELDMPSPMYRNVKNFPGMLDLISGLKDLRSLILGFTSRDWPLLRAIISLDSLENLSVFDSCWSNQIWIYLLASLGQRLRGLTVIQGRRPLQGTVLTEGLAIHCRHLTMLSIPFIPIMNGPEPVLEDDDLIPVIKACPTLRTINVAGQSNLGDGFLLAASEMWTLRELDIRKCNKITGKNIKRLRWQRIERIRIAGCDALTVKFQELVMTLWLQQNQHQSQESDESVTTLSTTTTSTVSTSTTSAALATATATSTTTRLAAMTTTATNMMRSGSSGSDSSGGADKMTSLALPLSSLTYSLTPNMPLSSAVSVLDRVEERFDPIEMGWVRQREDDPPISADQEDEHFFADWYR